MPIDLPYLDGDRPVRFEVEHHLVGVIGKIRDYTEKLHASELGHELINAEVGLCISLRFWVPLDSL